MPLSGEFTGIPRWVNANPGDPFPGAFLNGTLMTGMMVYLPDRVRTFDSRRYRDEN